MDNHQYIKVGQLFWLIQAIPESTEVDTVTVEIRRLSDNYTWNFSTTAFTSPATTCDMTFVTGILWKQSFTPPTEDTYIVTVTDSTLDVSYVQVLKALGAVAQSGVTGTELTTLAHVKEVLKIPTAVTTDDDLIQNLITRISDDIEKTCGRSFHSATFTEYYNGDGGNRLLLNNYPISSITSLYDDTDRNYGSDTLIDSGDYISDDAAGMVILDGGLFAEGLKNIKITYVAGYSTIPSDLERACIDYVIADYLEAVGAVNVIEGQDFIYKPAKLREQANRVIERYKRIG